MPDLSITATPDTGGRVRYDLGRPNWGAPVPDLRRPGSSVRVPDTALVDVVILGDGYTGEADFRAQLDRWLAAFFAVDVYAAFAGAFRIRALHVPSDQPASVGRRSFYRVKLTPGGNGVARDGWVDGAGDDDAAFRTRLWQSVDAVGAGGLNARRYSPAVDVGEAFAIRNAHLRDTYRNLVVSVLVRSADDTNVSGMTTNVRRDPAAAPNGRVAFGANSIHEFSHAFGFLSDEYIDGRDRASDRRDPDRPSVHTLSNLTFSDRDDTVPWAHLAPTGHFRRAAGGDDPPPVAGWLWVGGVARTGVWHSEYRCLMNGTHDNFAFTQDTAADPTADPAGTYTDEHGAALRDGDRFCAWCQEITTIRIHEKTDLLAAPGDPVDPTQQGVTWFQRWVRDMRANYYTALSVAEQIRDAEARYAGLTPGRHGEALWRSDLYRVPAASTTEPSVPPTDLDDGELHLLTGYTAIP